MFADDVAVLESYGPEIDLDSSCFKDDHYTKLKEKIESNKESYPDIKIVDEYVYIRTLHYDGSEEGQQQCWKLWVPQGMTESIIKRSHSAVVSAHGGMAKTLDIIRRHFFWPGMVTQIRAYIRDCEICKTTKAPNFNLKPPMGQMAESARPFQRLYIDILGPYPRSKQGNIGILIVLDHFSKFHWLYLLKKFTSKAIQEFLQDQIFFVYGVPEILISDNGSQFKANDFNAFLTTFGIRHMYTALYSPQSNASERVNRSIVSAIRSYLSSDQQDWDLHIPAISCALRSSHHQSIGCSPYHALYGFNMITHGSCYQLLKNLNSLDEPRIELQREDQLKILRKKLRENVKEAYNKQANTYNLRTREVEYKVGQEVLRRNFVQSNFQKGINAKLCPTFLKSRVREKLGNVYYVLEDLQGKLVGTFHAKDIRQ